MQLLNSCAASQFVNLDAAFQFVNRYAASQFVNIDAASANVNHVPRGMLICLANRAESWLSTSTSQVAQSKTMAPAQSNNTNKRNQQHCSIAAKHN
jgi:hypothetical protein